MILVILVSIVVLVAVSLAVLWMVGERGQLIMRSTPAFFRAAGGWGARLHAYVYGRWTRQYLDVLLNRLPSGGEGGKWLAQHYHGKVLTHDHAEAIVMLDRPLEERDLELIFPVRQKNPWVSSGSGSLPSE
jgi:hypothetical protein